MSEKIRYVDFSPAEFNDGITGENLGVEGVGVYWIACSIMYAKGTDFVDEAWLVGKIKAMTGSHAKTIKTCIDRLISSDKMVRKGAEISAKRVQKELEKALKRVQNARENGAKSGGRPIKNNRLENQQGLQTEKLTTNHQPPTTIIDSSKELSCEFDIFWNLYPNKKSKPNALKAYMKAIKKGVPHETIIRGLGQHADYWRASGTERQFIPHPATWLNGERWNDDLGQAGGNGPAHGGRGAQEQVGGVLGAGLRLLKRERAAGR